MDWLKFQGPLRIIRYENLLTDLTNELNRLLSFLNCSSTESVVRPKFDCVIRNKNGSFKRPSRLLEFDPFSLPLGESSLRQYVEKQRKIVYQAIKDFEESKDSTIDYPRLNNYNGTPSIIMFNGGDNAR